MWILGSDSIFYTIYSGNWVCPQENFVEALALFFNFPVFFPSFLASPNTTVYSLSTVFFDSVTALWIEHMIVLLISPFSNKETEENLSNMYRNIQKEAVASENISFYQTM